jgi:hypothetical protein
MRPYEYSFDNEFQVEVNGSTYNVFVSGMKVKNEFSSSLYPTYDTEIEKVMVTDYLDDAVTPSHEDYEDIMEEIYAMDFEEEYEEECFGLYDEEF